MHRFYLPGPYLAETVELKGDEAEHLGRVLRIRPGELVTLFDGEGTAAVAEVQQVGKRSAHAEIQTILPICPPRRPMLTLAIAPPKADRLRWLVEKATEIGVDRLIPLETARSVVKPGDGKMRKLGQAVIAACKQCGRNDLMEIAPVCSWDAMIQRSPPVGLRLLADRQGVEVAGFCRQMGECSEVLLAIGPEGGMTDDEREQAVASGFQVVSLGSSTLRIETAALCGASFIRMIGASVSV